MKPLHLLDVESCHSLRGIFCDIDDTLTTGGKLLDVAFTALWQAQRAGLRVVPITGRPAGWVDHMARMWPVDAVIGENGAFYFWLEQGRMRRCFVQDEATRCVNRQRLQLLAQQILQAVPQAKVAADQDYRANDLAIDCCEEVAALQPEQIDTVVRIFQQAGAQAKVSSIHVNGWFGDYDKLSTCRLLMRDLWQEDPAKTMKNYLFIGDSPNDEPMFAAFPLAVGVANIQQMVPRLRFKPAYVTTAPGGQGFAECVALILKHRQEENGQTSTRSNSSSTSR